MLSLLSFCFQFLLLLVCRFLKSTDLFILFINDSLHFVQHDRFSQNFYVCRFFAVSKFFSNLQVVQVSKNQLGEEVMFNVVKRFSEPTRRSQAELVQFFIMLLQFNILSFPTDSEMLFYTYQCLIIHPLLVLHKNLVLLSYIKLGEILTDDVLHLDWIEVLLIRNHIAQTRFDVFKLLELNGEHITQPFHVFLDIVISHSAG